MPVRIACDEAAALAEFGLRQLRSARNQWPVGFCERELEGRGLTQAQPHGAHAQAENAPEMLVAAAGYLTVRDLLEGEHAPIEIHSPLHVAHCHGDRFDLSNRCRPPPPAVTRSEEHTSELESQSNVVC